MTEYKKYFIIGTNDFALKDTMNGLVTGELIRCKDCKYWCTGDGLLPTIDGKQFHACWELIGIGADSNETLVPSYHYCGWAERIEE